MSLKHVFIVRIRLLYLIIKFHFIILSISISLLNLIYLYLIIKYYFIIYFVMKSAGVSIYLLLINYIITNYTEQLLVLIQLARNVMSIQYIALSSVCDVRGRITRPRILFHMWHFVYFISRCSVIVLIIGEITTE